MARKFWKTKDIVTEVKIILDENDSSEPLLMSGDIKQLKTDELIEHLIGTAIDRIVAQAPLSMLVNMAVDANPSDLNWDKTDPYCVKSVMPTNMARLMYVRLKSWQRGVVDIINDTDDKYLEYRSDFAGIRPDTLDPGVALRPGFGGNVEIECYPSGDTDMAMIKYIPVAEEMDSDAEQQPGADAPGTGAGWPDGETSGTGADGKGFVVTSQIKRAVLYMVANLYYVSLGEANRAELMAGQVKDIIGLYNETQMQQQ